MSPKAFALFLLVALAAKVAMAGDYKQFYLDAGGHRIEASDAIIASVQGGEVYKCQSVEAKVSKSGTSIGIRNVKKPKKETN